MLLINMDIHLLELTALFCLLFMDDQRSFYPSVQADLSKILEKYPLINCYTRGYPNKIFILVRVNTLCSLSFPTRMVTSQQLLLSVLRR